MAFDWRSNITLAREMARRADETAQRCAVGRAYYAVFGAAREQWEQGHFPVPLDVNVHYYIWNEYKQLGRLGKFIGEDGRKMASYRNIADYEPDFPDIGDITQRVLTLATKTLANLDAL